MPKSFRRTPGRHCFRRLPEKFRFSEFSQCRFSSVTCHPSPVPPGALRTASPPWPEHRTHAWPIPGVGGDEPRRRWRFLWWLHLPWWPARARARSPRHPAPPNVPWLSACPCHTSARPWHRHRGPASTERAPCRRRARAAPFRRARPKHPNPSLVST